MKCKVKKIKEAMVLNNMKKNELELPNPSLKSILQLPESGKKTVT